MEVRHKAGSLLYVLRGLRRLQNRPCSVLGANPDHASDGVELAVNLTLSAFCKNAILPRVKYSTNNPSVDIYGYDADGNIVREIQVKMTENPEYIQETLKELPEGVELISGAEMAVEFPGQVLAVGLSVREIGEDARTAVEILSTQEPMFNDLATSVPFAEYVRKEGIAFA